MNKNKEVFKGRAKSPVRPYNASKTGHKVKKMDFKNASRFSYSLVKITTCS